MTGSDAAAGPGARWLGWAAQHATVGVRVDPATELVPAQTATEAFRVFVVTQTVFDPQGRVIDTRTPTVGVVLHNPGTGWEVSAVDER